MEQVVAILLVVLGVVFWLWRHLVAQQELQYYLYHHHLHATEEEAAAEEMHYSKAY